MSSEQQMSMTVFYKHGAEMTFCMGNTGAHSAPADTAGCVRRCTGVSDSGAAAGVPCEDSLYSASCHHRCHRRWLGGAPPQALQSVFGLTYPASLMPFCGSFTFYLMA